MSSRFVLSLLLLTIVPILGFLGSKVSPGFRQYQRVDVARHAKKGGTEISSIDSFRQLISTKIARVLVAGSLSFGLFPGYAGAAGDIVFNEVWK
jgi:hypothetical protein